MWFFRKKEKMPKPNEDQPSAPRPVPIVDLKEAFSGSVLDKLQQCISDLSNGQLRKEEVDAHANLFECGYIDSLKSAELVLFIEKQFSLSIPEVHLVGALNNLEALARYIELKSTEPSHV